MNGQKSMARSYEAREARVRRRKDEEGGEEGEENDGKSLLTTYNGIEQINKQRQNCCRQK